MSGASKKETVQQLDDLMTEFSVNKKKEILPRIVPLLAQSNVLVPAAVPDGMENGMLDRLKKGARVELPKGMKPAPALLSTPQGGKFFGVYTEKKHVKVQKEYPLLLDMRFVDCCKMAMQMNLDGIVVNAFSQNLTFKKQALEAFVRGFSGDQKPETKQVRLTKEQFEDVTRKNIELHLLPKFIFEGGAKYIDDLCEGKAGLLSQVYAEPFLKVPNLDSPYAEADFSVMDLNVAEDIMLVRMDLPEKKMLPGSCRRIYVTLNPDTEEIHYFTIQKAKKGEPDLLGEVGKDGKHNVIGNAPAEGVEIQRVMDLVHFQERQAN